MRNAAKGMTVKKTHEKLVEMGYKGKQYIVKPFAAGERRPGKEAYAKSIEGTQKIGRKSIISLMYKPIGEIEGITESQLEKAIGLYPSIEGILGAARDPDSLGNWLESAKGLGIEEVDSFIVGLERDAQAVRCAFEYEASNGLAEGSVNKAKVYKRVMYGRCSFELLKAKVLKNEELRPCNAKSVQAWDAKEKALASVQAGTGQVFVAS